MAQRRAAQQVLIKLASHPLFQDAKNIGFYLSNDGEISPDLLLALASTLNKNGFLPSVNKKGEMDFRLYEGKTKLVANRYGIMQPHVTCRAIAAKQLDLVLVPLVAFDARGNRLGMGGGYYDRFFAFKKKYKALGPNLIGLAHQCQQVENLTSDIWDIPMAYVATDKKVQRIY